MCVCDRRISHFTGTRGRSRGGGNTGLVVRDIEPRCYLPNLVHSILIYCENVSFVGVREDSPRRNRDDHACDDPIVIKSVMVPFWSGTLKSTRSRTSAPWRSMSRIVFVILYPRFATRLVRSIMRFEKPHSLSYQAMTFAIFDPIVWVDRASMMLELGLPTRSLDTSGSSV